MPGIRKISNTFAIASFLGAIVVPLTSVATQLKEVPTYYRSECGSCHVPYPPDLLADGGLLSEMSGWREIMDSLRTHFGENAELDESMRQQIRRYLVAQAGNSDRSYGSRSSPPRVTGTLWFRRTHGKVKLYFDNARIGSAANCQACHPRAERLRYARDEVILPKAQRR